MPDYTFLTNVDKNELEKKIDQASQSGTISDAQIESAVEDYFEENPIEVPVVSDSQISDAVEDYFEENPIKTPTVSDSQISDAVEDYFEENPIEVPIVSDAEIAAAVENYMDEHPIDSSNVNLDNYYTKTEVDAALDSYITDVAAVLGGGA